MTRPMASAAPGNPSRPIAATQRGEKITPPAVAPLYAEASAAGRDLTNQGEMIAFTAAAPHRGPSAAAEQCRKEQLPRLLCHRPSENAGREGDASCLGDSGDAESLVELRQIGDHQGAKQVMGCYRGRNQRQRPTPGHLHSMQVDRRAEEAEAPAERRQHEDGSNDTPPIECLSQT